MEWDKNFMDRDIYENGEFVGMYDIPKAEADALAIKFTEETGIDHDWHWVGGRVVVLKRRSKVSSENTGTFWLIEKYTRGYPAMFWAGDWDADNYGFIEDPLKAVRFCRQADANSVLYGRWSLEAAKEWGIHSAEHLFVPEVSDSKKETLSKEQMDDIIDAEYTRGKHDGIHEANEGLVQVGYAALDKEGKITQLAHMDAAAITGNMRSIYMKGTLEPIDTRKELDLIIERLEFRFGKHHANQSLAQDLLDQGFRLRPAVIEEKTEDFFTDLMRKADSIIHESMQKGFMADFVSKRVGDLASEIYETLEKLVKKDDE